jgi:Kdo2-lipid IVA lauroyltransferase/acyltransferase
MTAYFYKFLYALARVLALLPLSVLFILADIMFFLFYCFPGYRRKVVLDNLRHSFPEMPEKELKKIRRSFYRHLSDLIIEIVKSTGNSLKVLNKRFVFKNVDLLDKFYDEGRNPVLLSGHYGNWEWMMMFPTKIRHKFIVLYRPLENKYFDDIMNRGRSANGNIMIPVNYAYRNIIKHINQGDKVISWFIADQTPPPEAQYWTTFFNREAAFFQGAEKLALKTGDPVVFMNIQKVRRGYYEIEFTTLFESTSNLRENEITEKYVRVLENSIKKAPEYWLWTHKRWKHKRPLPGLTPTG